MVAVGHFHFSFKLMVLTIKLLVSYRNAYMEVRHQTNNAARISELLRDVTWRNKCMTVESKIKICKAVVRPIMTQGAERRAATTKTKQLLWTTEMNTLRAILGKTRFNRMKNGNILEICNLQEVVKFVKSRRKHGMNMLAELNNGSSDLQGTPDQTPNDHQDDHQNEGRIAGSCRSQEHPKLYSREEEQANIAFLKKQKKKKKKCQICEICETYIS